MCGVKEALLSVFREVGYKAVSCGQVTKRLIQVTYVAPLTRLSLSLRVPLDTSDLRSSVDETDSFFACSVR